MDKFKNLMTLVWNYGKEYFTGTYDSIKDWEKLDSLATDIVKSQKEGSKEKKLVTEILLAIQNYIVADWNEKHKEKLEVDKNG